MRILSVISRLTSTSMQHPHRKFSPCLHLGSPSCLKSTFTHITGSHFTYIFESTIVEISESTTTASRSSLPPTPYPPISETSLSSSTESVHGIPVIAPKNTPQAGTITDPFFQDDPALDIYSQKRCEEKQNQADKQKDCLRSLYNNLERKKVRQPRL